MTRSRPPKQPEHSDHGAEFRAAVDSVTPLRRGTTTVPVPRVRPPLSSPRTALPAFNALEVVPAVAAGETVRLAQPGVASRTLRRLDGDRFVAEAEIDLHGLTAPQAARALDSFIADCLEAGCQRVRVIHGKGGRMDHGPPVLKSLVIGSLKRHTAVLALRTAGPRDGASGALRILLRHM